MKKYLFFPLYYWFFSPYSFPSPPKPKPLIIPVKDDSNSLLAMLQASVCFPWHWKPPVFPLTSTCLPYPSTTEEPQCPYFHYWVTYSFLCIRFNVCLAFYYLYNGLPPQLSTCFPNKYSFLCGCLHYSTENFRNSCYFTDLHKPLFSFNGLDSICSVKLSLVTCTQLLFFLIL